MKVSDEVLFLEEAFDVLNQRFFESALSRPAITIQSTPGAHGHFTPYDAWDDGGLKLKEINLGEAFILVAGTVREDQNLFIDLCQILLQL